MDLGLLVIRLVVGGLLIGHGAQKLSGRFGGGIPGTAAFLAALGLRPASLLAAMAGLSEVAGGLLLAVGLLPPVAALLVVATMAVAARTAHAGRGLWVTNGGAEYVLVIAAVTVGIAIVGPGALSADAALGLATSSLAYGVLGLAGGLLAAWAVLASRAHPMTAVAEDGAPAEARNREAA